VRRAGVVSFNQRMGRVGVSRAEATFGRARASSYIPHARASEALGKQRHSVLKKHSRAPHVEARGGFAMSSTTPRHLFVAGATGATGRTLMRQALAQQLAVTPHVRPKSADSEPANTWPGKAVLELADAPALAKAMQGSTTVLQLIGTMRKRFAAGDTYETSDIGTTRQLVDAAKAAGVDHFVLLTSVGAGRPVGAYLKAKAEAERIVRESGIPYTMVRPPALEGEYHRPPGLLHTLGKLPLLGNLQPMHLEQLAAALLRVSARREPLDAVLEGKSLWAEVAAAGR
jgi:uncharacterized protein YbjT (DUF2867 family)